MIIIVSCGFIMFDVITGILEAMHERKLNSTQLREGLYHKISEILALLGAYLMEQAANQVNLGIHVPTLAVVATYICIMETISCLENLCAINQDLCKLFSPYLAKLDEKKDNEE